MVMIMMVDGDDDGDGDVRIFSHDLIMTNGLLDQCLRVLMTRSLSPSLKPNDQCWQEHNHSLSPTDKSDQPIRGQESGHVIRGPEYKRIKTRQNVFPHQRG